MEGLFFYSFNLSLKVVGTLLEKSTYYLESCYHVFSFSTTWFLISKIIISDLYNKATTIWCYFLNLELVDQDKMFHRFLNHDT